MTLEPDLTVEEVAEYFRVHPETVRRWLRDGAFSHAYRPSRRAGWRIPREDIAAFRERTRLGGVEE